MSTRPDIVTLGSWKFFELFMTDLSADDRQRLFFNAAGEPLPEGFSIHRLEENTGFLRFPLPPLRHFQYDVFFLRRGRAVRMDGLTTYDLVAPAIQFTAPGHIITNREAGDGLDDVEGYFLMLDPDFLVAAGQPNLLPELPAYQPEQSPVLIPSAEDFDELDALLNHVAVEYRRPGPEQARIVAALLSVFFLKVKTGAGSVPTEYRPTAAGYLTARFQALLARHVLTLRSVRDYAELLCVTPDHLSRSVRETTGRPASELITDMLLLEAKVLLRQTDLSVAEVAFRLRFEDASYFGRLFRKRVGRTPLEYRQSA
jgi:AraC-like DNA-binding protein